MTQNVYLFRFFALLWMTYDWKEKNPYCPVELKRSKPEGLARIQAGGKRSATPAIRYISQRKPRMGGRILQQCSTFPSFCHPFGVWDALVPQRRGCTPACGLPPLWGLFGSTVLYEFFSNSNLAPPFILPRGNERVAFGSELGTYLPIVGYHIFSIPNRYPIVTR